MRDVKPPEQSAVLLAKRTIASHEAISLTLCMSTTPVQVLTREWR